MNETEQKKLLEKILKNKKPSDFKTYAQHKMSNTVKQASKFPIASGLAKRIPAIAIGYGAYTIGNSLYKLAKEAYPDLKNYTTIEPTAKDQGSHTGWITKHSHTMRKLQNKMINYSRDYEPSEIKNRTEQLEMTEYGLSQNSLVKWIQKNFTERGKKAVEDKKLKSVEK